MSYRIEMFMKCTEEDDYQSGCVNNTMQESHISIHLRTVTLPDLLEQIRQFFSVDSDDMILDACEELGRIDVMRLETEEGYPPAEREMLEWQQGSIKLWSATYTGYVYKCVPCSAKPITKG